MVEEISKSIPIQRYGTVEDIANAGIFLFSPAASYITGAALVVDGGEWHNSNQVSLSPASATASATVVAVLMSCRPPQSRMVPYPEVVLQGGDFRALLASKL